MEKQMRIAGESVVRFACQEFIAFPHQRIANKQSKATEVACMVVVVLQKLPGRFSCSVSKDTGVQGDVAQGELRGVAVHDYTKLLV